MFDYISTRVHVGRESMNVQANESNFAKIAMAVLPSNAFSLALPRVGNAMHDDPKIVSEET